MATKGTPKWFSEQHERRVAFHFSGRMTSNSGAPIHDQGDVRAPGTLIECKHTGTFEKPRRSISVRLADVEKIAAEAYSEGKWPALALSVYDPNSPLANPITGCVDMIVRLLADDGVVT